MVRSAALRSLSSLEGAKSAKHLIPLLNDRALVIRSEALDALVRLKPEPTGLALHLARVASDASNYHKGRPQWLPARALSALLALPPHPGVRVILLSALSHTQDNATLELAARTLEHHAGISPAAGASVQARLRTIKGLTQ